MRNWSERVVFCDVFDWSTDRRNTVLGKYGVFKVWDVYWNEFEKIFLELRPKSVGTVLGQVRVRIFVRLNCSGLESLLLKQVLRRIIWVILFTRVKVYSPFMDVWQNLDVRWREPLSMLNNIQKPIELMRIFGNAWVNDLFAFKT